jgi:ClpP class serine protease
VGGSFGFAGLMDKLGIERRLYTSGENKAMLDPFLPEKPEDVEKLKAVQRQIHESFIELVRGSRGSRLKGPDGKMFSGEYWTGETAVDLGLADGIGDLRSTLRARYGDKVLMPLVSPPRGWFGRAQPGLAAFRDVTDLRGRGLGAGAACRVTGSDAATRKPRKNPDFARMFASATQETQAMPPFVIPQLVKVALGAAGAAACISCEDAPGQSGTQAQTAPVPGLAAREALPTLPRSAHRRRRVM